jgi:hypothetical protein
VKVLLAGAAAASVAAVLGHSLAGRPAATATQALKVREPAAPRRPAAYALPRAAAHVSTSAQLARALARRTPRNIVLAPGIYDRPEAFSNGFGHRLYAAKLGRAILRAGLGIAATEGGAGAVVRGLTFDVRDASKTLNGAAIAISGSATNARVLDTKLKGNHALTAGVLARQPAGLRVQRVVVRDFTGYGVLADTNDLDGAQPSVPFRIEDVDVANVLQQPPRSSNGTAEACLWLGDVGVVRRVRVRNCAWMGIWTGTAARNVVVADADIDRTPTGIYIEHFTKGSTFQAIRVHPRVRTGVVAEWADPVWGGLPASVDNVIQESVFESRLCGVYLDEGTTRTTVRRSVFRRQTWAAIGDYRGIDNAFYRNDYRGIARTAVPISHDHVSSAGG